MTAQLVIVNAAAVGLFGIILSVSFCEIKLSKQNFSIIAGFILLLGILQAILFSCSGAPSVRLLYPLITHLPLVFLCWYFTRKLLWSLISVLTAYLCCQLRRWIALFFIAVFSGGENMQIIVELVITIPLMLCIIRFASPAVRDMTHYPLAVQIQFGLVPAVGYAFDYLTRVYTDWLIMGIPAAVEFMPFVCSVTYLAFALYSSHAFRKQSEMEQIQTLLALEVKQSGQQLTAIKESQRQAAAYRHDLRHHLQYLSTCLENDAIEQARSYIHSLDQELTQQAVTQYCENTAVNLILSSFVSRAEQAGVELTIHAQLGEFLSITDNDLCVLLSNALENALNACVALYTPLRPVQVEFKGYTRDSRIFLEITNTCDARSVKFKDGIPITHAKGHGIGVRSICAIVEKYGGIYLFETKGERFILRISL